MNRLLSTCLAALVTLAAALPTAAQASGYTVTDLGVISGAVGSYAMGINDSGTVAGYGEIPPANRYAFATHQGWVWIPSAPNAPTGSLRTLAPLPGWAQTEPLDVSDAGLIVGRSNASTTGQNQAATFWQAPGYGPVSFNNLPRDPALAGWWFSIAQFISHTVDGTGDIYVGGAGRYDAPGEAIYDGGIVWRINAGAIVGVARLSGWDVTTTLGAMNNRGEVTETVPSAVGFDAFLWDSLSGSSADLVGLGGKNSFGQGINDYGAVVGQSDNQSGLRRAFLWTPAVANGLTGTMVDLGTLGGSRASANGINNLNQIVGSGYLKGDHTLHACLWSNGAVSDLNSSKSAGSTGLELLDAFRINNHGAIIGMFSTTKGRRAYLLTPR